MIEIGDFILIPTTNQTKEEWLNKRQGGIGGSDMGTLYNVNPYKSVTELFYSKLGRVKEDDLSNNPAIFHGTELEDKVLNWSCYQDDEACNDEGEFIKNNYVGNCNRKNKIASHVEFPYMVISKKTPWIISNLDGMGFYDKSITTQDLIDQVQSGVMPVPDYIVEIKTISPYSVEKYASGIPPHYPYQVKTYMIPFLELNPNIYAKIYAWCYDQTMTTHRIELTKKDATSIKSVSKKFQKLIYQGRVIIEEATKQNLSEEEIDLKLSTIHPSPSSSAPSLGKFLSDKFLSKEYIRKNKTIQGDSDDLKVGLRYAEVGKEIKVLNEEKTSISNALKNKLVVNDSQVIDLSPNGRISYGKRLTINVKK